MMIKIDNKLKEYLDKVLHGMGAEAWHTAQIKLDLKDYNGAIKEIANNLHFEKCLNNNKLSVENIPFEKTIRVIKL